MTPRSTALALLLILTAVSAHATSFVVPPDAELLDKSGAVIIGTVEASYVSERDNEIETTYEIRVSRRLKGQMQPGSLVTVTSPGGFIPGVRGVQVIGAPRFDIGERVLLFLTRSDERWSVTDLTLGRFRFVTSMRGERLLVRDMDDVFGWQRNGQPHQEPTRLEEGFIRFLSERAVRRNDTDPAEPADDYFVTSEVTFEENESSEGPALESHAPFPGWTYVDWVSSQPTRRQPPSATFYKRSGFNIPGAADGGVSAIQSGLAAWTNAPGTITLSYGGERSTASANHDGVNMVEFNDPQGRVSGSWGGSGTIGITFLSFSGTHTYESRTWWNITDADVVFQDNYSATHPAFAAAMTHELGHAIGFRHSNQHYSGGGTCDPAVEECTSAAIMNSSVSGSYGYTLQPWDLNAVSSVYAGATTSAPGTPGTLTATATSTTSVTISWGAASNATQYELERSTNIASGFTRIATITGTSYVDSGRSPNTTYVYRVRATNSGGNSTYSNLDHATTIVFTDDPLISGFTVVKAVHLAELRTAVNAMRIAAGLSTASWTDPASAGIVIKAIHITELRNALSPALSALGKGAAFTDSLARGTIVKAIHFQEIRNHVK